MMIWRVPHLSKGLSTRYHTCQTIRCQLLGVAEGDSREEDRKKKKKKEKKKEKKEGKKEKREGDTGFKYQEF